MHDRVPDKVTEGDPLDFELLEDAPAGAFTLAGIAVALLVLAWLLMYFEIFVPRGQVG